MPLDDNDAVLDSSSDTTLDDATIQNLDNGADQGATGADSSDAQGATEGTSTLDVVRDVVAKRDPTAVSPAEGQKKDGENTDGTGSVKKEADDEKFTDVPFHKHPRFQHLLKQRDAFKGDAEQYRNVQGYMDRNGIKPEFAAEGFGIMAHMARGEWAEAWTKLKPHVQRMLQESGEVLPSDLAQRVEAGELTPEIAREVAKANAKVKSVEAGQTFAQQQAERQRQLDLGKAIDDTCVSWREDRLAKDPNFAAKEPALKKEIAWLIRTEGQPDTPEGVRAQLDKAYKSLPPVAAAVPKTAIPTIGAGIRRTPSASTGASSNAQPKARSTLDIINGVIAARAG